MAIRIVRLGTARAPDEGIRLGTVRRPPRGVRKEEFSKRDFYDLWLPVLSPTPELIAQAKEASNENHWRSFRRKFERAMAEPAPAALLDLLAAFSRQTNFSLGCYCADEARCHRSILRALLAARGAVLAEDVPPIYLTASAIEPPRGAGRRDGRDARGRTTGGG